MSTRPAMPATLEELAESIQLPVDLVQRLAAFVQARAASHAFREIVDPALELLAGVVPRWSLLDDWNRWCFERGMSFLVWQPRARPLEDRQRLEAFVHTLMMLAAKQRNVADYRRASIKDAEIVMAGDDCVICDDHRHHVVRLEPPAMADLPPFHPGCRCGTLPRLDR
jgi:hypothetical protein